MTAIVECATVKLTADAARHLSDPTSDTYERWFEAMTIVAAAPGCVINFWGQVVEDPETLYVQAGKY